MRSRTARIVIVIAAYVFVLIPVYSLGAALEGGLRNLWPLTLQSLIYQGSAFLGQLLTFVVPAGLFAVPILAWVVSRYINRTGAFGVLLATSAVAVVLVATTIPFMFLALLAFPIALAVASLAYAIILMRTLHGHRSLTPAT